MVHGKKGLYLEAWKFGVYISIPIIASVYYSDPETQRYWADYWQYIKYPENPNTNVKEQIQKLAEQKELQREQRLAYQQQLQQLQKSAERLSTVATTTGTQLDPSSQVESSSASPSTSSSPSWWRKAGRWIVGGSQ